VNHQRIYDQIIERGQSRGLPRRRPAGFERHHIIPKSIGGTEEVANLVDLTPREHFIAHWLLKLIHGAPMSYAFWRMCQMNATTSHRPTSTQYAWARRNLKHSPESIQKMRLAKQNVSDETRKRISEAGKGRRLTEEHRKKWSFKGRHHTEEARRRMSEAARNCSEQTRLKLREAACNRSPTTRHKLSVAAKLRHFRRRLRLIKIVSHDLLIMKQDA
jgi:hypothetical protein